jgi:signal transduction histidine kinase
MEVEITSIPPLGPAELTQLEMHSLLNILNVLKGELTLIGLQLAGDPERLKKGHATCDRIKQTFTDPEAALAFASDVTATEKTLLAEIDAEAAGRPELRTDPEFRESLDNIASVFRILEVRAAETLARTKAPMQWLPFAIADLQTDFRAVFSAIEKNSHGRYRVIYNLARQKSADYYIDFVVESINGQTVAMPLLLKDVIRDLAANARKYTQPGGSIMLGLYESATELRFVIQDTGCGIPAEEIVTVVQYGRRGSNVRHVRTMGGGFGLTKAFLVTQRFGGRFWIKSEIGVGTRITLALPTPAKSDHAAQDAADSGMPPWRNLGEGERSRSSISLP